MRMERRGYDLKAWLKREGEASCDWAGGVIKDKLRRVDARLQRFSRIYEHQLQSSLSGNQ